MLFGAISVIGYGVLLSDAASGVHYFGCFLVAGGLYVVVGLPLAWVRDLYSVPRLFLLTSPAANELASLRQADDLNRSPAYPRQYFWHNVGIHLSQTRRPTVRARSRRHAQYGWYGNFDICLYVVVVQEGE